MYNIQETWKKKRLEEINRMMGMMPFKEQKRVAVLMWHHIRGLLYNNGNNKNSEVYRTYHLMVEKMNFIYNYQRENKCTVPWTQSIKAYDCIMCAYINCEHCPLKEMTGKACTVAGSEYWIVRDTLRNQYRNDIEIRRAARACENIIKAIKALKKKDIIQYVKQ